MIQLLKEDSPQEKPMFNPSRPDPGRREKINVSFRFHTSLWWLISTLIQLSEMHGAGRVSKVQAFFQALFYNR